MTVLSRLAELNERLEAAGLVEAQGYAPARIAYILVLGRNGRLVEVESTLHEVQVGKARRLLAREFPMPVPVTRTGNFAPNLLWDTAEYALGLDKDPAKPDPKTPLRHAAFKKEVAAIAMALPEDEGVRAVHRFLEALDPKAFAATAAGTAIEDRKLNVSFRLEGEMCLVPERPAVRRLLEMRSASQDGAPEGQCLVTGRTGPIARLHPPIKGVAGAQTSGARIVAFNRSAFESYGLTQGANAPVGTSTAAAIGSALNWLLRPGSRHRLRLGEVATSVAWTTRDSPVESALTELFGEEQIDEGERQRLVQVLRDALTAPRTGAAPLAGGTRFCVLTLAPNASRLAIAGWQEGPVQEIAAQVVRWFTELDVVRPRHASAYPSLAALLRSLAPMGDLDRLSPRLAPALLDAALTGRRLPQEVLGKALDRLRADHLDPRRPGDGARRAREDAYRAALIRISLLRNYSWDATMALDPENPDVPYRLGRLFALLEIAQRIAVKSARTTIRDQFFASAAATPGRVLPALLTRFNKAHRRKIEGKLGYWFDARIAEVLEPVQDMPITLSLPEQGRFALGYYHQRAWRPARSEAEDVTLPDLAAEDRAESAQADN